MILSEASKLVLKSQFTLITVAFLLVVCVTEKSFSQNRVTGTVFDEQSGAPVENTEIYTGETGRSWYTDENGFFEIRDLPNGTYTLYFFTLGRKIIQREITLDNSDTELTVTLQQLSWEMSEVTVTEQRNQIFSIKRLREVEGTTINAGKKNEVIRMRQLTINSAGNNARQIYSQIAGLNIYESEDTGLQLNIGGRGLDPNRSSNFNTRQNGYDISADVLGYPESYYTPPAEALEEIQVIRGAASLQYGTQFGGLVNFRMKSPATDNVLEWVSRQSTGSDNLFTSFNSLSGTSGNFGYYGYANYKSGSGFRPNSDFESTNVYTHLDYRPGENTTLSLELTYLKYTAQQAGGLTDAQFYDDPSFSNRSRNWFDVDWKLGALKLHHHFSYQTELDVTLFGLSASRKSVGFRTNRVSQLDDPTLPRDLIIGDFRNWGSEVRLLNRYDIGNVYSVFLIGTKFYQSNNRSVQGPGSAGSSADFNLASEEFPYYFNQSDFTFPNQNIALFGENIFYIGDKLTVTPGIRFEYINTQSDGSYRLINRDLAGNPIHDETINEERNFKRHFLLFGLGIGYLQGPGLEIYGNFSKNYRSVTFNDIRVVNPSYKVDPDISDEQGFTSDLGVRGQLNDILSYDINGFLLMYNDRLGEVLRAETRENASGDLEETGRVVRFRGNIGRAVMFGLESLVEWNLSNTFFPAAENWRFNLFANTALTDSRYFHSEIPGVEGNRVEFIPALNLKTGTTFGYKNLMGSLQYTWLSRQYTDASNAKQNRNDNQSGIAGEIPAYDVMDLSFAWSFNRFKLEAGVNNLLNNVYFTRRATGYPGPGIIPSPPRSYYITLQLNLGT